MSKCGDKAITVVYKVYVKNLVGKPFADEQFHGAVNRNAAGIALFLDREKDTALMLMLVCFCIAGTDTRYL